MKFILPNPFSIIGYYLYYIANSDKQLFTFCISFRIF